MIYHPYFFIFFCSFCSCTGFIPDSRACLALRGIKEDMDISGGEERERDERGRYGDVKKRESWKREREGEGDRDRYKVLDE